MKELFDGFVVIERLRKVMDEERILSDINRVIDIIGKDYSKETVDVIEAVASMTYRIATMDAVKIMVARK